MATIQAMLLFLVYFGFFSQNQFFAASSYSECGVRPMMRRSVRIVGGSSSTFGKWPWHVLVINHYATNSLGIITKQCGGALVTERFIITAAHCCKPSPKRMYVVLGDYDIRGQVESKRNVRRVVKYIKIHPQYNESSSWNDIAVLELLLPVRYDSHIVPICMPANEDDFAGQMAWLAGWGRLKYNGSEPSILRDVKIPIVKNQECQNMLNVKKIHLTIPSSFLCAGYSNVTDGSCMGDSGGPLVMKNGNERWMMVGLASATFGCGEAHLPGLYMRLTSYVPWLKTIIYDLQF